ASIAARAGTAAADVGRGASKRRREGDSDRISTYGTRDMSDRARKFIILCAARTGSTMLRHLLNSHPRIVCHGEVMSVTNLDSFAGLAARSEAFRQALADASQRDRRRFLEEYVLDPGGADAVGFKIKYEELLLPDFAWLLGWLRAAPDLSVIHLRRENRLKRLVSQITATRIYRIYNITDESQRPAPARIEVTPEECLADFAETESRERLFHRH